MINLPAIYIANGTAIALMLVVLTGSKKLLRNALLDEKIYFTMLLLTIVQSVTETIIFWLDGKMGYGYHTLLVVLNAILYINDIIFVYAWVVYSDYKLFADARRLRNIYLYMAVPGAAAIIGSLINLCTPVFFEIDRYNVYHRTDLFFFPFLVGIFYLAYGLILSYSYRNKVGKYLFLPSVMFLTSVLAGALLQYLFYGYAFMWLGIALGLTSLFLNVQNELSYIDTLSGVFNRQYLKNVLLMYSKKDNAVYFPAGIMLDIDNFKSINDTLGHSVGDNVISEVGKILHTAVLDKGEIFRYGGDEFIVLMYIKSQTEILDMIDSIKAQAEVFNESENRPYKINFSIGYSIYETKCDSTDDFLKKIDDSMYKDKNKKIKEKIIADRRQTC